MIPLTTLKPLLAIAATLTITAGSFLYGKHYADLQHQVIEEKQATQLAILQGKSNVVNEKVITQYQDKIKYITQTKVEYVDRIQTVITKEQDAHCVIPNSFISLHDAASQGLVPPAPTATDDNASSTALSTIATTVTDNYLTCNQTREQLISLQDWIKQQEALTK